MQTLQFSNTSPIGPPKIRETPGSSKLNLELSGSGDLVPHPQTGSERTTETTEPLSVQSWLKVNSSFMRLAKLSAYLSITSWQMPHGSDGFIVSLNKRKTETDQM